MILLQASLIGEDVTDCVIVVHLDDEESSAMVIPIDGYDISGMGFPTATPATTRARASCWSGTARRAASRRCATTATRA